MTRDPQKLIRFDWAIKNIFKKNQHLEILQSFLSDLLQKKIASIRLCDTESTKESSTDKSNRVDVHVVTDQDEEILIEVQAYPERDYYSRIVYATSKIITSHMHQGDSYYKIPKIISINICYFNLGEGQDYIYKGTTNFTGINCGDTLGLNRSEKKIYLTKADSISEIYPEYYIIKINKFQEEVKAPIDEWIYFFKTEKIKETFHSDGLKKAAEKLNYLKLSKAAQREYQTFMENLSLERSYARSKEVDLEVAKDEGRAEGRAEGKIEIAKKMIEEGVSLDLVSIFTGLRLEELDDLS